MTLVHCQICGKDYKLLCPHLVKHNITVPQYKSLYPNEKTISDETYTARSKANTKENNPLFGKKRKCPWVSERNKKNIGEKNHFFGRHCTKEHIERQLKTKLSHRKYITYTSTEKYYPDLKIKLKSSWEANVVRMFVFFDIEWKYEPKIFKLKEGLYYCPDFYLPQEDLWIEVKGYMRDKGWDKINTFKNNHNLKMIEKTQYEYLMQNYLHMTPERFLAFIKSEMLFENEEMRQG